MRKKREMLAVSIGLVLLSGVVLAQTAGQGQAPQPTAEHKKLGYFVGKWTSEGDLKPNPWMPGGKYTSTDTCEWFEGGFALLCRSEGKGPMGPTKSVYILGYSTEEKAYTYYGIDNSPMTMASVPKGTVQGDTWTFNDEAKMGGKMVKSRYSIKEASPTSYSFKWESVGDDGSWKTVMEGKSTKAR
jgi:hypothetical protein